MYLQLRYLHGRWCKLCLRVIIKRRPWLIWESTGVCLFSPDLFGIRAQTQQEKKKVWAAFLTRWNFFRSNGRCGVWTDFFQASFGLGSMCHAALFVKEILRSPSNMFLCIARDPPVGWRLYSGILQHVESILFVCSWNEKLCMQIGLGDRRIPPRHR